ncbi:MAG: hypothetical protein H8E53_02775, partial [Planctomycetes bacterium]|nr:hypothetical protein [Planctomycetota bacterium]
MCNNDSPAVQGGTRTDRTGRTHKTAFLPTELKETKKMARRMAMMDGNHAVAYVAHKVNEVIAIYPITPSSAMGEHADAFSAAGQKNIWGTIP